MLASFIIKVEFDAKGLCILYLPPASKSTVIPLKCTELNAKFSCFKCWWDQALMYLLVTKILVLVLHCKKWTINVILHTIIKSSQMGKNMQINFL